MEILKLFVFSFCATIGFSILFSIPKNSIIKSGLIGALGWIVNIFITNLFNSPVSGVFCSA